MVASIFVNPKQFAPHEDFASYPRDLEGDMAKLATRGIDAVFAPDRELMYPAVPEFRTYVDPAGSNDENEGAARPGFFRCVWVLQEGICFELGGPLVRGFDRNSSWIRPDALTPPRSDQGRRDRRVEAVQHRPTRRGRVRAKGRLPEHRDQAARA